MLHGSKSSGSRDLYNPSRQRSWELSQFAAHREAEQLCSELLGMWSLPRSTSRSNTLGQSSIWDWQASHSISFHASICQIGSSRKLISYQQEGEQQAWNSNTAYWSGARLLSTKCSRQEFMTDLEHCFAHPFKTFESYHHCSPLPHGCIPYLSPRSGHSASTLLCFSTRET